MSSQSFQVLKTTGLLGDPVYESGQINGLWTGALNVPAVIDYVKIGKSVTLFVNNIATQPATSPTGANPLPGLALNLLLPHTILPLNEVRELLSTWRDSASLTGLAILQVNGQLTLYSDDVGSGWARNEQCGYGGFSLVYIAKN